MLSCSQYPVILLVRNITLSRIIRNLWKKYNKTVGEKRRLTRWEMEETKIEKLEKKKLKTGKRMKMTERNS
jgi:hypothetical protein